MLISLFKNEKSSFVQPYNNAASSAKLYLELNLKEKTLRDGIYYQGEHLPCHKVGSFTVPFGEFRSATPLYTPRRVLAALSCIQTYKG
jgi:hypothetical protein